MDKRVVLATGFGVSIVGGIMGASTMGLPVAVPLVFALAWTFLLAFAGNRGLSAMMRSPQRLWKALMPSVFCFGPFFLGAFPVGNWLTSLRPAGGSIPTWLLLLPTFLFLGGLLGPGDPFLEGIRRAFRGGSR